MLGSRFFRRVVLKTLRFLIVGLTCWLVGHSSVAVRAQNGIDFELPPLNGMPQVPVDPTSIPVGTPPVMGEIPSDVLIRTPPPVDSGLPVGALPVDEVIGESPPFTPVWYNPLTWIGPSWNGSFEIGINGSEGNAVAQSFRTGFELSRETRRTNWELDLNYAKNTANGVETQHNALVYSNWDYKLSNPRWSWFNKIGLEYDEFKDFDIRLFWNTGLGYQLIDTPTTQFRPRFGAGASREFGGVDDDVVPEAVFGFDFAHQISKRQKFSAVVDYFPAWEDFGDYRLISDLSWEYLLDEATNLSLKLSVLDRYDSTPNSGDLHNDLNYALLLLWKL